MKTPLKLLISVALLALSGCATVDITKTGKGYFPPTNPNEIQILMTVPTRPFIELGTFTVANFPIREEAKMHNALRAKAAPLGATAVILQSQGMINNGTRWATGVAIRFQ